MKVGAPSLLSLSLSFLLVGCAHGVDAGEDDKRSDNNGAEVVGPDGVFGYRSDHALFSVFPIAAAHGGGGVLVDTGFDEGGADLARAVAGRKVRAVLVTHAHVDHWSGVATLGDVPVYIGTDDVDLLEGRRCSRSFAQTLVSAFWPKPALPPRLIPVADHLQVIALDDDDDDHDDDDEDGVADDGDGDFFFARHLPGHTAGSTVWLWHDIAFTGDALFGDEDGGVSIAPALLSDDNDDAARAGGTTATVLLDAHGGRTDDAAIAGYLNRGRGPHSLRRSP